MFQKNQKLFCIDERKIVLCTFVCDVVLVNGDLSGKFAVEIKENTITTLWGYEIFETEKDATDRLTKKCNEQIALAKDTIMSLELNIKEWEKKNAVS